MKTNFFETLVGMSPASTWTIVIKPSTSGRYSVGVLMNNPHIKSDAIDYLIPKNITGSIIELDEKFFGAIVEQIKNTDEFFTNQLQCQQSLEQAKQQSKPSTGTVDKEKMQRQKKVDEVMKKVSELQQQEKHGEAIGQLQSLDLKNFPEHTDIITAKIEELKQLRSARELF